ncbi:stefin-C-like isoform X1 [Cuculus canorus]|uniref:stefin-C-like n=1 Tax=Cuculus canorus TaxID=55661 RepID=UPI0023AAB0D4|nr:stefin-C-like [Cuculus canorus]XP_053913019.1 stefin-C-like isoform X1 [Cuculus canorus]
MTACFLLIFKSEWCWEMLGATLIRFLSTETGSSRYKSCDPMPPAYIPGAWCLCSDCTEGPSSETPLTAETLPATIMSGQFSDPMTPTPEIQEIANRVKSQLEKEVGRAFTIFNAVLYRYQKSVGTSYLIKVEVADGDFNHLLVFQPPLDRKVGPELVRYWTGKTRHDPLEC